MLDAPTFIAQAPGTPTSQALPSRNEPVSFSRAAHVGFSQDAGLSSVEASLVSLSPFLHYHHLLLFLHFLLLTSLRQSYHLTLKPMARNNFSFAIDYYKERERKKERNRSTEEYMRSSDESSARCF